jgi:hypothetical protein
MDAKTDTTTRKLYEMELAARNKIQRAHNELIQEAVKPLIEATKKIKQALQKAKEAYEQISLPAEQNFPQVSQTLASSVQSMQARPPTQGSPSGPDPLPFENQERKTQEIQDLLKGIDELLAQAESPIGKLENLPDEMIRQDAEPIRQEEERYIDLLAKRKIERGTRDPEKGEISTREEIVSAIETLKKAVAFAKMLTNKEDPKAIPKAKEVTEKTQNKLREANNHTKLASELLPIAKQQVDRANQELPRLTQPYQDAEQRCLARDIQGCIDRDDIANNQAQPLIDAAKSAQERAEKPPTEQAQTNSIAAGKNIQQAEDKLKLIYKLLGEPNEADSLRPIPPKDDNLARVKHLRIEQKSYGSSSSRENVSAERQAAGQPVWDGRPK